MSHIRILVSILAVVFVAHSTYAAAQTSDPDLKALAAYKLDMATVRKVMAVTQNFVAEAEKDPKAQELKKIEEQIKALEEKEELTAAQESELEKLRERAEKLNEERDRASGDDHKNDATLADMEAAMKKEPIVMRALAREGLTPRDYALCTMALLQASMVEGFSQGKLDMAKLPAGVNPENIKFVREHKAELEALQESMKKTKK